MCVAPLSLGNYSRKKIIHEHTRQHHLTQQDSQGAVQSYTVLFPSDYPKQYSCSVSSLLVSLEPTKWTQPFLPSATASTPQNI